jgi:hypothetical protein
MPCVSEVTLALAALANPARREVAYRAAIWQAGNGSHKRGAAQTTLTAAWWCEAGGTTAGPANRGLKRESYPCFETAHTKPATMADRCARAL